MAAPVTGSTNTWRYGRRRAGPQTSPLPSGVSAPLLVARTLGESGTFERSLSVSASVYSNITCSRQRRSHGGPPARGPCAESAIADRAAVAAATRHSLFIRVVRLLP